MKKCVYIMILFMLLISFSSCKDTPLEDTLSYDTIGTSTTLPPASEETSSQTVTTVETVKLPETPMSVPMVTEELDKEKNAVKITVTGDGAYYFPAVRGTKVENFKYELIGNSSGYMQANPLPMETPVVVYYSLSDYMRAQKENHTLWIKSGDGQDTYHPFTLDIPSLFSDDPLTLKHEFLHAALTEYFGGKYSERDLLTIEGLFISYGQKYFMSYERMSNFISIQKTLEDTPIRYDESRFFHISAEETAIVIPETLMEDLSYFHALRSLELVDSWEEGSQEEWEQRRERYKELARQTARGYEPTEDTWSQYP